MNKSLIIIALGVLLSALTIDANSQTKATLKGIVLDQNTSQPVIGAHIYLPDGQTGSASDENGFFQVTGLNSLKYTFFISAIGYETKSISVDLSQKKFIEERILLIPKTQEINQLVISGRAQQKRTETNISVHHLDAKQIEKIPAYGATPDLVQYLQMLPGITFTGDQGGQLYIRGGSQSMNKFLVDGISLYNPIHSMGLFSVIDTDILQGADVYTGGFGAKFSGAIASAMDVRIRTGNMKEFNASVSVDPFQTSVLAEGPIVKKNESRNFSISYLLSGKQSLIDRTSSFYPHLESNGLPFSFRDFLGKISMRGNSGDKLDVLVFNNSDGVNYPGLVNMNWQSMGGGIQATIFPYQSKAQMHPYIYYSSYKIDYQTEDQKPSSSLVNGFQAGLSYKQRSLTS